MLEIRTFNEKSPYKRCKTEPMLYYKGKPMFAFGPMSETSTFALKLGSKAFDVTYWSKWQNENGMGYVRGYLEQGYGWVDTEVEGRLYPFDQVEPHIFNLNKFNIEYWQNLKDVAEHLANNDIIIHLQLVQVCYFKEWEIEARRWQFNYWNPDNNVNDFTKRLKPEFPFSDQNSELMNHWKRYITSTLDAIGNYGNVIIDIGNELSSEKDWIEWNIEIIKEWEKENEVHIIKGLDFTHMSDPVYALNHEDFDVIITHGESVDEAPVLRKIFKRPVISVISRDTGYLGLGEGEPPTEDRFRRLHYRCLMNKVQGMGDYGKMMGAQDMRRTSFISTVVDGLDPKCVEKFASDAKILKGFFNELKDYSSLAVNKGAVISSTNRAVCYCLKSEEEIVIYLESGINEILDGTIFDKDDLLLAISNKKDIEFFNSAKALIINPSTGSKEKETIVIENYMDNLSNKKGENESKEYPQKVAKINLPSFKNDLLIYIWI